MLVHFCEELRTQLGETRAENKKLRELNDRILMRGGGVALAYERRAQEWEEREKKYREEIRKLWKELTLQRKSASGPPTSESPSDPK